MDNNNNHNNNNKANIIRFLVSRYLENNQTVRAGGYYY